jgi:hypothetical protein
MSFVSAAPELVTVAAGDLAEIGSALGAAHAAAALPTTGVVAAAADEVSTEIASLFGAYAQEYQALSAKAAAFHTELVSLLNSSGLAYLSTEVANAEQNLLNAMMPTATGSSAATTAAVSLLGGGGLLGGLGAILGGSTGAGLPPILGGLSPFLGGLNAILTGGNLAPYIGVPPIFSSFEPIVGEVSSLLFTGGPLGAILTGGPLGPTLSGIGQDLGGVLSTLLAGGVPGLLSNPLGPVETLLQPLLPGLFDAGETAAAAGGPYQMLFANTSANLQSLNATWAADPFPFLRQVVANQQGYAQTIGTGVALVLENLPATLANVPANVQLAIQGASTFNPGALAQTYVNQQIGYTQTVITSLQKAGADFQTTVPVFEADISMANAAIAAGNYHGAVQDVAHGILGLFITGFDTSNLSNIQVLGPGGDLLPILSIPAQQAQNFTNLLPPGSIPAQIAQNYTNAVTTLTNANVSTTITLQLLQSPPIVLGANFGLPLSLAFAVLGPPISTMDGFATGATVFGAAVQAGNGVAAVDALVDMPAYVLNGFLNGQTLVDLSMPVTVAGITVPITMHLPFDGILVAPQPITATVDLSLLGIPLPINLTLGGTPFAGLVPELLNNLPEQLALAITPK